MNRTISLSTLLRLCMLTRDALRRLLRGRAAAQAIARMDDRQLEDIGLPVRGDRPAPRSDIAVRIAMMSGW